MFIHTKTSMYERIFCCTKARCQARYAKQTSSIQNYTDQPIKRAICQPQGQGYLCANCGIKKLVTKIGNDTGKKTAKLFLTKLGPYSGVQRPSITTEFFNLGFRRHHISQYI